MAAMDSFEDYLASLATGDRDGRRGMIEQYRSELLASRSEEARVRIVQEFMQEMTSFVPAEQKT